MVPHETPTEWAPRIQAGWVLVQTLPSETTENDLLGLVEYAARHF